MTHRPINAANAPAPEGRYAQGRLVETPGKRLYISGQIPMTREGEVPTGFEAQARQVWDNILAQLSAANMSVTDLAKITIYLSDRTYTEVSAEIRRSYLGNHAPALTVIIADIFDEDWLLEIEAIAET